MARLVDLFSSIRLGLVLLALLFVYSAIGSAGAPIGPGMLEYPFLLRPDAWVPVREFMEISEFEWFHWWPFDLLIALICVNLVVATIRRVPLNLVNLGVWMIHTGIIVLALGSVWYFGTKVEGDVPVARRQVLIEVPGHEPASMVATPGNATIVGSGADAWTFRIASISPEWELLSGADAGKRAYKVSVAVRSPAGSYTRDLIDGAPQITEDLSLSLAYAPRDHFYVVSSAALYVREAGTDTWYARPIDDLPRFKDHIAFPDAVWASDGDELPSPRPLDIEVPAVDPDDPLADVTIRITDYLRYASLRTERRMGGDRLDPAVSVRLAGDRGREQDIQLIAFDPRNNSVLRGALSLHWVSDEAQVESMLAVAPPMLRVRLADEDITRDAPITATGTGAPFNAIEGTSYAYRVMSFQDDLPIEDHTMSVAILEISNGERTFTRWVFDDPRLTRDLAPGERLAEHAQGRSIDDNIEVTYIPGARPGFAIVGGPGDEDVRLIRPGPRGAPAIEDVEIGTPIPIRPGLTLTVRQFTAHSYTETRPTIVARARRDRDMDFMGAMRMVRVSVPTAGGADKRWLLFHRYAFDRPEDVLARFLYRPSVVPLPDGRAIEILYARARHPLPAPVVLDDFRVSTHIGGYTGTSTSIRDWTSVIRFQDGDSWTALDEVSVNAPSERDGFWFFQSLWDPPVVSRGRDDPGSPGLNYTVLGVGNRQGVLVQLAGCCLSVLGMIWAFYVKPVIKRRRQDRVYDAVAAGESS
ncbi:MAG: hypothetical protein GY715_10310 [Planctomycetes bacterium]|nr:hypothetical protein [Planctomycetota bacterium]